MRIYWMLAECCIPTVLYDLGPFGTMREVNRLPFFCLQDDRYAIP